MFVKPRVNIFGVVFCPFWKPLQNKALVATVTDAMAETLSVRVRARLRDEMVRKNLNQTDIADLLKWKQSRTSKLLNGRTEVGLEELDALCFAVGLRPTEAVRDHGLEFCAEMTPTELRILERIRQLTDDERDAFIKVLHVAGRTRRETRSAMPQGRKKYRGR